MKSINHGRRRIEPCIQYIGWHDVRDSFWARKINTYCFPKLASMEAPGHGCTAYLLYPKWEPYIECATAQSQVARTAFANLLHTRSDQHTRGILQ